MKKLIFFYIVTNIFFSQTENQVDTLMLNKKKMLANQDIILEEVTYIDPLEGKKYGIEFNPAYFLLSTTNDEGFTITGSVSLFSVSETAEIVFPIQIKVVTRGAVMVDRILTNNSGLEQQRGGRTGNDDSNVSNRQAVDVQSVGDESIDSLSDFYRTHTGVAGCRVTGDGGTSFNHIVRRVRLRQDRCGLPDAGHPQPTLVMPVRVTGQPRPFTPPRVVKAEHVT